MALLDLIVSDPETRLRVAAAAKQARDEAQALRDAEPFPEWDDDLVAEHGTAARAAVSPERWAELVALGYESLDAIPF